MDIKIVYHPSGDWEALYIDDELKYEGHSVYTEEFICCLQDYLKLGNKITEPFINSTRDLGNEEGFDAEDFGFPLKYEDIKPKNQIEEEIKQEIRNM